MSRGKTGDRGGTGQETPAQLRRQKERAFAYIRCKIDELLSVMGTAPLRPEELDDGTLLELDPIGIIGTSFAQILSHLKDTNRDLKKARDEITAIFDTAGVGILVLDRDRNISAYNSKQAEFFKHPGEQIYGAACCSVMCGRSGKGERCTFNMVMDAGRPVRQKEWVCNGRHFDVVGTPLRNEEGEIEHVVLSYNDITERILAEKRLKEAKAELERQNNELKQLDGLKDGLIRDVSHELKTPVAKHVMQLEILRPLVNSDRVTEAERKAFAVMQDGIRRQEKVIRNLLDLSRLEAGGTAVNLSKVPLQDFLSRIASDYDVILRQCGARISLEVPDIVVVSDGELLHHVLTNIIDNALKFRKTDTPLSVTIAADAGSDEVCITVADNGVGMETEVAEKAFDRFYQYSSSAEGSGVGLAICQHIVSSLGGRIAIASPGPGKGVTLSVTLPLEAQGADRASQP